MSPSKSSLYKFGPLAPKNISGLRIPQPSVSLVLEALCSRKSVKLCAQSKSDLLCLTPFGSILQRGGGWARCLRGGTGALRQKKMARLDATVPSCSSGDNFHGLIKYALQG